MKRVFLTITVMLFFSTTVFSQLVTEADSTGYPGDDLDLDAVIELFKKSNNLEEFEKNLNDEKNGVNNLDLNNDGEIDYIRVIDNADSNAHAIALQVPVNETESQDVAVIEVEKDGNESAKIQITGDDDVYGDDYTVEPYDNYVGKDDPDPNTISGNNKTRVVVNVWGWPCVRYMYAPVYRPWISPWYWRHYPGWWKPWRPCAWGVYHRRMLPYRGYYYHRVHIHRVRVAHRIYYRHRVRSAVYRQTHRPMYRRTPANTIHPRNNPKGNVPHRGGGRRVRGAGRRR